MGCFCKPRLSPQLIHNHFFCLAPRGEKSNLPEEHLHQELLLLMGSALGSTRESRRKGRISIHHPRMHHWQTSPSRHPPAQISATKKKPKTKNQAEVENKCALNATQMTLKMQKKYVFAVALHDFMGLFPRYTFHAPFPHRSPPLHPLGFFKKKKKLKNKNL